MTGGLFDDDPDATAALAPEPPGPELSYGAQLTARRKARLAAGVHPLAGWPLLPREQGKTCGGCANLIADSGHAKTYYKCRLKATHGAATDVRVRWPACDRYKAREDAP